MQERANSYAKYVKEMYVPKQKKQEEILQPSALSNKTKNMHSHRNLINNSHDEI